jgi:hypothetical protein
MLFFSPFCLREKAVGFFLRRITTYGRDSSPSRKADDAPISGACVHKRMPKLACRWLLLHSSIRHSPLNALDLGHPQLSLNQAKEKYMPF